MKFLGSLTNRIFLASAALAVMSIGAAVYFVSRTTTREAEAELGVRGTVGCGTPGAISPATGRLRNANSTWLNDRPLDRDLSAALARPVAIANDADCFAVSEATDGAAAGAATVFGVILGTGVGGGIAVHQQPLSGPNAIAGEWGHNPLPWPRPDELPGPRCYCGNHGCIETWLCGPGLARDYRARTGRDADPPAIAAAAAAGERAAGDVLHVHADRMARALATVINILDPEVIVLGGGLSRLDRPYAEVPARWGRYVFSDTVRTRLVPPAFGDSSGVRGAAWLGAGSRGDAHAPIARPDQHSGGVRSSSCSSVASSRKSP